MAARVSLLFLLGCASSMSTVQPTSAGNAPEISDFKARFPEFYDRLQAQMTQQFHGEEVAKKAELGSGRWRAVVRIDIDPLGDSHGCRLLRSCGFNALDDEALAACRRLKEHLFPPEGAVEADLLTHVPVQLSLDR